MKNTPLFEAVWDNNLQEVKLLIERGADINERCDNLTPLYAAVENCSLDCLDFLLEAGVDVELEFGQWGLYSPLNWVIDAEITSSTEGLWGYGNIGDDKFKPVPVLSERLLLAGADPDRVDSSGVSPRDNAENRRHLTFISLLKNLSE